LTKRKDYDIIRYTLSRYTLIRVLKRDKVIEVCISVVLAVLLLVSGFALYTLYQGIHSKTNLKDCTCTMEETRMKKYLKTPEEIAKAIQTGKRVETDEVEYRLVGKMLIAINKADKSWAVNAVVYSEDNPYIAEPEPLNLEVGKFYKTRDGGKAWIIKKARGSFPFLVAAEGEDSTYTVNEFGSRYRKEVSGQDIIGPWND